MNEHGNFEVEAKKGQIAVTEEDIKNIPDIIKNPTEIVKGNPNKLGETIRYIKEYSDNKTYVVEVIPDNSDKLIIKTMWKKPSTLTNSENAPSSTPKAKGSDISSTSTNNIISQNDNIVKKSDNIKYSLSDNQGRTLTEEQQEYFKNVSPKLKDENNNLKVFYHGTARADRLGTVFVILS